jgi:hypothetical protein
LHRRLALLGTAAFALHGGLKLQDGLFPELLWGCNVSAVVLILGFAFEWPMAVGAAFLWRLVLGEPGFLAGLWSGERYGWTTVFVHLTPTVLGALYLRRSGLPRGSAPAAALGTLLLVPLSRWLSPPALNVNFAHHRVPWLEALVPGRWSYRLVSAGLVLGALWAGDLLGKRWFGRRPRISG